MTTPSPVPPPSTQEGQLLGQGAGAGVLCADSPFPHLCLSLPACRVASSGRSLCSLPQPLPPHTHPWMCCCHLLCPGSARPSPSLVQVTLFYVPRISATSFTPLPALSCDYWHNILSSAAAVRAREGASSPGYVPPPRTLPPCLAQHLAPGTCSGNSRRREWVVSTGPRAPACP